MQTTIQFQTYLKKASFGITVVLLVTAFLTNAQAEKISNTVAVFSGIDKFTGRIISFDVYVDETV